MGWKSTTKPYNTNMWIPNNLVCIVLLGDFLDVFYSYFGMKSTTKAFGWYPDFMSGWCSGEPAVGWQRFSCQGWWDCSRYFRSWCQRFVLDANLPNIFQMGWNHQLVFFLLAFPPENKKKWNQVTNWRSRWWLFFFNTSGEVTCLCCFLDPWWVTTLHRCLGNTPPKTDVLNPKLKVWFRWFSFWIGWCLGSSG